ncbi:MAG: signal peptidase II [Clostridiales bacterium]|nr:signal peptidase II [Clostridiales bacterium]
MNRKIRPSFSIITGIVCFVVLTMLDQVTKELAVLRLKGQEPVILIRQVFQLYYLENHGAAFGILQGKQSVFFIITIVILAVIVYVYARLPFVRKYRVIRVFLVMISAGAIGNLIDRVSQGYVVDFFYFNLIDFPVFNVADIYVTCATILLVLTVLFRLKEDDITEIVRSIRIRKT